MFEIREYLESDWPMIWPILREIIRAGDTYTFSPQSTEEEIRKAWVEVPAKTFVACDPKLPGYFAALVATLTLSYVASGITLMHHYHGDRATRQQPHLVLVDRGRTGIDSTRLGRYRLCRVEEPA